ncbi:MAG: hypothetical protein JRC90_12275 [Deltaproteobacteria bacterium]|nr:hypothetical protein [Deltaproteobacteria bacterium]
MKPKKKRKIFYIGKEPAHYQEAPTNEDLEDIDHMMNPSTQTKQETTKTLPDA